MNTFQKKKKIFVVCIARLSVQLEKNYLKFPLKSSDWNVLKNSKNFFENISFKTEFLKVFIKPKHRNPDGCALISGPYVVSEPDALNILGNGILCTGSQIFPVPLFYADIGPNTNGNTYFCHAEMLRRIINLSRTRSLGQTQYQAFGK